jgi:hypothetical protein
MATADLALRVVAQVDQAIAGLRRLGEQTKAVDTQAAQAQSTYGRWGDRLRGLGGSFGLGGAGAGGGGGLGGLTAVIGGVAGGVVGAIGAQLASSISDAIDSAVQRKVTNAQQNLQQATSGQDIAKQISDIGQATGNAASPAAWWHLIKGGPGAWLRATGDVLTGNTGGNLVFGGDPHRAQLDAWRELVRAHPEQAADALARNPRLGADYRNAYTQIVGRSTAAQQYANVTNINVNTGVADKAAVGREVRAALDARDRNNGQYVTTLTRRG